MRGFNTELLPRIRFRSTGLRLLNPSCTPASPPTWLRDDDHQHERAVEESGDGEDREHDVRRRALCLGAQESAEPKKEGHGQTRIDPSNAW